MPPCRFHPSTRPHRLHRRRRKVSMRHRPHCIELVIGDGVCWIARIKLPEGSGFTVSVVEMKSEIATINFVKSHSTIPVPEVYGYNLHGAGPLNGVGAPYILFQALPGRGVY